MESRTKVRSHGFADLPEEILEHIFLHLSPYSDYINLRLVNSSWNRIISGLIRARKIKLFRGISSKLLSWTKILPDPWPVSSPSTARRLQPTATIGRPQDYQLRPPTSASITPRYSHCAVCVGKRLFVFGGSTCQSTVFNDLWELDLGKKEWSRLTPMGTYPMPKANASLVFWEDNLVLFGGYSQPSSVPRHQEPRFFSQLHSYSLWSGEWELITFEPDEPSPAARSGHSAVVMNDFMILFGGVSSEELSEDIWVLDLVRRKWHVSSLRVGSINTPGRRFNCTLASLDKNAAVLFGGWRRDGHIQGSISTLFDVWLLTFTDSSFTEHCWQSVTVSGSEPRNGRQNRTRAEHMVGTLVHDKLVFVKRLHKKETVFKSADLPVPATTSSSSDDDSADARRARRASSRSVQPQQGSHRPLNEPDGHLQLRPPPSDPPRFDPEDLSLIRAVNPVGISEGNHSGPGYNEFSGSPRNGGNNDFAQFMVDRPEDAVVRNENGGREGQLGRQDDQPPPERANAPRPGLPSVRPNAMSNRQRQLEVLEVHRQRLQAQQAEQRLRQQRREQGVQGQEKDNSSEKENELSSAVRLPCNGQAAQIDVLDLSEIKERLEVRWLPADGDLDLGPAIKETVSHSLVVGNGELIMFGGLQALDTAVLPPGSMAAINDVIFLQPTASAARF